MTPELKNLYVNLLCWRQAEKNLANALRANAHPAHIRILRNMVEKNLRGVRESVDAEPWGAADGETVGPSDHRTVQPANCPTV
jgi:hypothetical protein